MGLKSKTNLNKSPVIVTTYLVVHHDHIQRLTSRRVSSSTIENKAFKSLWIPGTANSYTKQYNK